MNVQNAPAVPAVETSMHFSVSDEDVDRAVAECGGDPRETIRALLIGHAFLDHELARLTSRGYLRGAPLATVKG